MPAEGSPATTGRSLPLPPITLRERVGATTSSSALALRELRQAVWWHEDHAEAWLRQGAHLVDTMREQLPADVDLGTARILDFGCGAGRVLRHLVDVGPGTGELHGVDIDGPSIAWLRAHGGPRLHARQVLESPGLPYPDDHFDLVYALSVFTHLVEDWAGWLLEVRRVLRPGGVLLATVIGPQTAAELRVPVPGDPGMYARVLGNPWDSGGPVTVHSPDWVAEHWGRALEVVSHAPRASGAPWPHDIVVARPRPGDLTVDDLLAPGADAVAEGRAQAAQLRLLREDALALRTAHEHAGASVTQASRARRAAIEAAVPERHAALVGRLAELEAERDALSAARTAPGAAPP